MFYNTDAVTMTTTIEWQIRSLHAYTEVICSCDVLCYYQSCDICGTAEFNLIAHGTLFSFEKVYRLKNQQKTTVVYYTSCSRWEWTFKHFKLYSKFISNSDLNMSFCESDKLSGPQNECVKQWCGTTRSSEWRTIFLADAHSCLAPW